MGMGSCHAPVGRRGRHLVMDPSQTWESWPVHANGTQEPTVHAADHELETYSSLRASLRRGARRREDVCPSTEELGLPGEQRAFVNNTSRDTFAWHV